MSNQLKKESMDSSKIDQTPLGLRISTENTTTPTEDSSIPPEVPKDHAVPEDHEAPKDHAVPEDHEVPKDHEVPTKNEYPEEEDSTEVEVFDNFDDMNLPIKLLRGIYAFGFEKPSAIQQRAIVALIKGRDLIAQAQSGTGKTGAFTIGTLARLTPSSKTTGRQPQILIISPTRELSEQTSEVVKAISLKMDVQIMLCIGGTSVNQDIRQLRQGCDVIIGTPGRIYDLIMRKALRTNQIKVMVLDEADEMLSHGFKDQIYEIFVELPQTMQTVLVSATLPIEVHELSQKFMRNPQKILVKNEELTLEGIRQFHVRLDQEDHKFEVLIDLWNTFSLTQTIIYVNTKRKCQWLSHRLSEQDYAVSEIHSNLSPAERKEIMSSFKNGGTRILITTDLLARGIDVQQVALIVNYDLPQSIENYLHRIGRSGRFGRKGLAINLLGPHDESKLNAICQYYSTDIPEMPNDIASFFK